ncbi:MAG: elongation factor G [Thermodesulfobacteriota bacterium]
MKRDLEKVRNIAVIAHGRAGKTSLSDSILFGAGVADRLGVVEEGTSNFDFEPEETKKRLSINSAIHHYEWNRYNVTLIDTPGYANFIADARSALRVVEGALVVVSAISGVGVQTEKVWQYADEYGVKKVVFINKLDRDRADFSKAVDSIDVSLGIKGVPIQMPMGEADSFNGVIDLIKMKAYIYNTDRSGKFKAVDIPDEFIDKAGDFREKLVESVAESDDILIEKYLESGELTNDEILEGLKKAVHSGLFAPVMCGSALMNIGIQPLMDTLNFCFPSPVDNGLIKGKDPKTGEDMEVTSSVEEPFSAFVFKTVTDPYTGKLAIFRVYSGMLNSDSDIFNPSKGIKERIGQILLLEGKKQRAVESASAGDIVAIAKLKGTSTGDTLCSNERSVLFPPVPSLPPSLSFAIEPKTKADEDKVNPAVARLMEEDQTLKFHRDDQTKEFILSGVGQTHLEVVVEKLKRKFGVHVELKTPKVSYKETIRSSVKVQGKYKKQSGGRGQYGDTWLEIEPLPHGKGFEFVNKIVGGVIPKQYIPAVEKGVSEAMLKGPLAGYPVVDVRVTLYDGSHHSVDSSEMAFKIAGSIGFKKGVAMAKPVLLEPIMSMEVNVSDENMGDVIGDLNSKRGKVQGVTPKGSSQVINVLVPMAEVLHYATDLRSLTGGRGDFTMEFACYEEIPVHLSQKIISALNEEEKK